MAANLAAAAAAKYASENPKAVNGAVVGGIILVVLILGGVGFASYKMWQKIGLFDDKNDRLAKKRMLYFAKWQGFNPRYHEDYFSGMNTLNKQPYLFAEKINDSFGTFNDDESQFYAAMESIGSAQNLSAVSKAYQSSFGKSLRNDIDNYMNTNDEQDKLIRIVRNYSDFKQSDKRTT